jgi:hypothetical protein
MLLSAIKLSIASEREEFLVSSALWAVLAAAEAPPLPLESRDRFSTEKKSALTEGVEGKKMQMTRKGHIEPDSARNSKMADELVANALQSQDLSIDAIKLIVSLH